MFLREPIFEKRESSNDSFERCNERIEIDVQIEWMARVVKIEEDISLDKKEPIANKKKKNKNILSEIKSEKKKNKNTKRKNKKTNHKSDKPTMESF